MATKNEKNREELERIAEYCGDNDLMQMFWYMFDDLPASKQKIYIEWAKKIVKEEHGIDVS